MITNFSNLKLLETEAPRNMRLDQNTIALFYQKKGLISMLRILSA